MTLVRLSAAPSTSAPPDMSADNKNQIIIRQHRQGPNAADRPGGGRPGRNFPQVAIQERPPQGRASRGGTGTERCEGFIYKLGQRKFDLVH